jgi:23S rRNA (guanosine2251-2'-O)-methyltransferase
MEQGKKLTMQELERPTIDEFSSKVKLPVVVVLDNIRSLHNVGSFFRTADAFAVESLYLCGITATPPNREIHKTALGATESVVWQYWDSTAEAIAFLKKEDFILVGVEQVLGGVSPKAISLDTEKKYALIFGNEVYGVGQELLNKCDYFVEIPQVGTKHSLNVAVSVGIVVGEFFSKLRS